MPRGDLHHVIDQGENALAGDIMDFALMACAGNAYYR